jgi:hypothetical protein
MNVITVANMPALTNDFNIMIPLQLTTNLMSIYIGFEAKGKMISVYRFGGSAVQQSINTALSKLFQTQTHTNFWNRIADWTILPTFSYLQQINLEQTNSLDAFTLITMSGSIMPSHPNPFMTFTIQNL